ncbi:hypothetical protein QFC21_005376 [Naganishia friedmannii]|uniref:Uncharacterized protein n=1 Tax=Naganishia friedmannii TaxID=89922 RepID=A0ACC2VAM0_9TREE|nr:hypothetical protein QFC21_005376 [Naganishia friedmannii]
MPKASKNPRARLHSKAAASVKLAKVEETIAEAESIAEPEPETHAAITTGGGKKARYAGVESKLPAKEDLSGGSLAAVQEALLGTLATEDDDMVAEGQEKDEMDDAEYDEIEHQGRRKRRRGKKAAGGGPQAPVVSNAGFTMIGEGKGRTLKPKQRQQEMNDPVSPFRKQKEMPGPTLFPPPPEITGIPTKAELAAYPRLNTWEQLKDIIEKYLIQARLPWKVPSPSTTHINGVTQAGSKRNGNGVVHGVGNTHENGQKDRNKDDEQYLTFEIGQAVDPDIYAILPNDWPYNTPSDVEHVVVWSKLAVFHPALVGNDYSKWEKVEQDGFAGFTGNPETQPPPVTPSVEGQTFSSLAERGPWGWCTEGGREVGKMATTLWPVEEYECAWRLQSVRGLSHYHVFARKIHT